LPLVLVVVVDVSSAIVAVDAISDEIGRLEGRGACGVEDDKFV
jgi:hypothetical protein